MATLKVKVKWGKESYDVDLDLNEAPEVFKAQLFALTGVTPDRQKVMCKGAILKETWDSMRVKDGATILMMGSKGEIPQAPAEKPTFLEDMDASQLATALKLPCGLYNLGNTCYLNAVVQCLRTVPELVKYLATYQTRSNDPQITPLSNKQQITCSLRDLFWNMEEHAVIQPLFLVDFWRRTFPQFAEKGENGVTMQQDANEAWTELVRVLDSVLWQNLPKVGVDPSVTVDETACRKREGFMKMLFGGELEVTMKCSESESECETRTTEEFFQLSCFISTEVRYLLAGLKLRMQENITKMSPTLGRDAVYQKTSKLSRLPGYLTVSIVRFFYKEKEAVNAKILKDVKFPMMLDVFELCSQDLQQSLIPQRDKFKVWEDEQVRTIPVEAKKKDVAEARPDIPFAFPNDPGSNNSGFYQLQAILTHKGRSSSSGHYVGWIRRGKEWFKCDDETVTPIHEDDIMKLSGGGDWHVAYVLLYGPRLLGVS
ncbi:ubiquitin carboxyl-terminal hydrolase 14 [Galendromus occidentalis]|uniref:Ubiquitin carboxyl-terminal hydrolase n=1 Tax=Galendromus occidentalis TaxID=34638 RepID=A0AAJ7L5X8_9ACAR|nr:ubiquitin carboxyl-terminal hydrolase 14 [Galendromus occidentalis]